MAKREPVSPYEFELAREWMFSDDEMIVRAGRTRTVRVEMGDTAHKLPLIMRYIEKIKSRKEGGKKRKQASCLPVTHSARSLRLRCRDMYVIDPGLAGEAGAE
jgi:hypothetical protein